MSSRREQLRIIAQRTLEAIERGYYTLPGPPSQRHDLRSASEVTQKLTQYFPQDSTLKNWEHPPSNLSTSDKTSEPEISLLEISTIEGARHLASSHVQQSTDEPPRIGVLNFASATKPGGGFLTGAQAQEESLARSSTLYPSLMTKSAQSFHATHKKDKKGGYYSHACIYSPGVVFFRDDLGAWTAPFQADVLTCAAVNAGVARKTLFGQVGGNLEGSRIEKVMKERMARILRLFEMEGVRELVLGSFGTGVFQNDVPTVARIWADLLASKNARFRTSFDKIVFAILGTKTFADFKDAFEKQREKSVSKSCSLDYNMLIVYR
jgi:uncharacterized protein (TIGR02452 family)